MKTTLVIAPHPDDEVYGCGGTIARLTRNGEEVHILIVTKGDDLFDPELIRRGREEARQAHEVLGVRETHFANLPAIKLDTLPQYKIADVLAGYLKKIQPARLFLPFPGDINKDHQIVHGCALVAARPASGIGEIYAYEALSSTNWNSPGLFQAFTPNVFVDIKETIATKLEAVKTYTSQLCRYPHERSPESVLALSQYRGGFVNLKPAEAVMCLRKIER